MAAVIGVFDSGHGGLTILQALRTRLPQHDFIYFGDHGHAPYGDRSHAEIVELTKNAVDLLFRLGCPLVVMACNSATAIAGRTLQQNWLPTAWPGRKLLGIIAPTVEAVTQTPWLVTEPVFPQRYNTDTVALFATKATVDSGVYDVEINKRCPQVTLVSQACAGLVPLIENGDPHGELPGLVTEYVQRLLAQTATPPHWAMLGCTHYPLLEPLFRTALPAQTRLLSQPTAVANALEDYLGRHSELGITPGTGQVRHLTSGNAEAVNATAEKMVGWPMQFMAPTGQIF